MEPSTIGDAASVRDPDSEAFEEENEDFYFESDHLALRGNADYRAVLRAIVVLEAQAVEAGRHIDIIAAAEKEALDQPEAFVDKLASGAGLDLPGPMNIENLPTINFSKYNMDMFANEETDESIDKKVEMGDMVVRGRIFDQTKPETFNQLWTCEEQRRLEELLTEYPPEPVEMRRFAKIARALGNRTTKQVASRLQKYFQKLHAAGLPVPGRVPRGPRTYQTVRKGRMHKHMYRPTTFFPSNFVPVNIDDADMNINFLDPSTYRQCRRNSTTSNSRHNVNVETMLVDEQSDSELNTADTDKDKIVRLLKRVKRDKQKNYAEEKSNCDHLGYECDFCKENPITGTRWHCITCKSTSVDFCSDCLVTQAITDDRHSLDHKIIGLRVSSRCPSDDDDDNADGDEDESRELSNDNPMMDKDYMANKFSSANDYNYLDPNFLPE